MKIKDLNVGMFKPVITKSSIDQVVIEFVTNLKNLDSFYIAVQTKYGISNRYNNIYELFRKYQFRFHYSSQNWRNDKNELLFNQDVHILKFSHDVEGINLAKQIISAMMPYLSLSSQNKIRNRLERELNPVVIKNFYNDQLEVEFVRPSEEDSKHFYVCVYGANHLQNEEETLYQINFITHGGAKDWINSHNMRIFPGNTVYVLTKIIPNSEIAEAKRTINALFQKEFITEETTKKLIARLEGNKILELTSELKVFCHSPQ